MPGVVSGKNPNQVSLGAGTLLIAPLGTVEPITRAAAWAAAWVELGYTTEGSEFSSTLTTEKVEVAEELNPLKYTSTLVETWVKFALAQITIQNLQAAFNGGTVTTGTADVIFEPPATGNETRVMLGWDALDGSERWIYRQCLNSSNIAMMRKKGADRTSIPCEFKLEKPAGKQPFAAILALTRQING